jgi:glucuronoarabinoxylan endo-1,4-beta-xylanase
MAKIQKVIALLVLLLSLTLLAKAQTATITWSTTYQTIDGFGASSMFLDQNTPNLAKNMGLFFNSSTGVGFSILRVELPDDGSCSTVNSACAGDIGTMNAALAINPSLRIFATPLSPPASMKTNGSTICNTGSGNASLITGDYGAYATYLTNYVKSVAAQGITLYAISVQNEPDYCPTTYDGAVWTAAEIDSFVKNNLGPDFAAASITVKIMLPESDESSDLASMANTTMTDSGAVGYVGLVATHDYASPPTANPVTYATGDKNFWETEASDFNKFDATMTSGLSYAKAITDWMSGSNLNSWNFWWLVGLNGDNEGLVDNASSVIAKRTYTMGNFSKFVRPNWVRVSATETPTAGVYITAYKDPVSGTFAIVAVNTTGSSQNMTFSFDGFTSTTVAPWLTDTNNNLAQQSSITASSSFTATLGASSVTTFVGQAETGASPPAPTNLTITGIS